MANPFLERLTRSYKVASGEKPVTSEEKELKKQLEKQQAEISRSTLPREKRKVEPFKGNPMKSLPRGDEEAGMLKQRK